jgi:CRP-like cAMP-binding protein
MEIKSKGTFTLRRLFPALPEPEIHRIGNLSSVIRMRKGQNLFISGDRAKGIYALANGCLKICRETPEGNSVLTRIVKPGHFVGIREIFGEFHYSRSAIALKESEVFSIDSGAVLDLVSRFPAVSLQFLKIFCTELASLEKRIEDDLYKTAKSRICGVVGDLHELFSTQENEPFELPLSRRDVAELADVNPETVSRTLAILKANGILEVSGNVFCIQDLNALRAEMED